MHIDHGGADVLMPQEFLDSADIIAVFEQIRGKRVTIMPLATLSL
jgi:hypothetical protein